MIFIFCFAFTIDKKTVVPFYKKYHLFFIKYTKNGFSMISSKLYF